MMCALPIKHDLLERICCQRLCILFARTYAVRDLPRDIHKTGSMRHLMECRRRRNLRDQSVDWPMLQMHLSRFVAFTSRRLRPFISLGARRRHELSC